MPTITVDIKDLLSLMGDEPDMEELEKRLCLSSVSFAPHVIIVDSRRSVERLPVYRINNRFTPHCHYPQRVTAKLIDAVENSL